MFLVAAIIAGLAVPGATLLDDGVAPPMGVEVLVDVDARLTLAEVLAHPDFAPAPSSEPTWGLRRMVVWERFHIDAVEPVPSTWTVRAGFPRPHEIDIWTVDDAGVVVAHAHSGLSVAPTMRAVPGDDEIMLPLTVPVGTHFVRAVIEPARLKLDIGTERAFASTRQQAGLLSGLYYGIFVGLFFFNLFFGLWIKDSAHLLYCTFVLCIAMQIAVRDGWLPTDMPLPLFQGAGLSLTSLSSLAFTRSFLGLTAAGAPRWHRAFSVAFGAAICAAIPPFFGVVSSGPAMLVSLANTILIAVVGVVFAARGQRSAQLFVLAWGILLTSSALAMLHALGVIHAPWTATTGVRVGAAVEMIVLALALAARVGALRAAKEQVERSLMDAERAKRDAVRAALVDAQEEERGRLSRDLHDGLGHSLLLIKQRLAGGDERVSGMVQEAIDDVRGIARALMPTRLTEAGLPDALRQLADDSASLADSGAGAGADVDVIIDSEAEDAARRLGPRAVHVFRVTQEALTNALRHGGATTVTVRLETRGESVRLVIVDNGRGLPAESAQRSGTGMASMTERAAVLGGTLAIGPRDDGKAGTALTLTFPRDAPERRI